MNHATETKKLNNQGFSLVELIIVVAIMAVLVGVLAPQYLQYVEKSRYQADMTMIDEIKGAIEVAIATDEDVYAEAIGADDVASFSDSAVSVSGEKLKPAVETVVPELKEEGKLKLTSKTLKGSTVTLDVSSDGTVVIDGLPEEE